MVLDKAADDMPLDKAQQAMDYLGGSNSKDAYLGGTMPYVGDGDLQAEFAKYDKLEMAKRMDAMKSGITSSTATGIQPRPPPCSARQTSP